MIIKNVKNAKAHATGKRLNAVEIWLGYFLIAVKSMIYSRKRMPLMWK